MGRLLAGTKTKGCFQYVVKEQLDPATYNGASHRLDGCKPRRRMVLNNSERGKKKRSESK